ncbi:hypothetical protein [Ochrobactrum sp. EDr1-4]|uniref:DUF7940 domain-containing protein n=1 Tax=Ochrobactrum sp. EDr1-4 TaxID=3368622 RepID=UPI003BA20498
MAFHTMKLVSDWRRVLRYAWSIRLLLAAAILSGFEVVLPYLGDFFPIPTGAFAALTFIVTVLAFVVRITSQKVFRNE